MDSEKRELRKRKIRRILIWIIGITAAVAIGITIIISSLMADPGFITC